MNNSKRELRNLKDRNAGAKSLKQGLTSAKETTIMFL